MKVEITISLKKGVMDAEGSSTMKALHLLGFKSVRNVKSVRVFRVEMDARSGEECIREAEEMCKRLLANPVIHEYKMRVVEK